MVPWTQPAPETGGDDCKQCLTEALATAWQHVQCPSQPGGITLTPSAVLRSCQDVPYHTVVLCETASHHLAQARDQPICATPLQCLKQPEGATYI